MVEVGIVIQAGVVRIENYGVYLKYNDQDVVVLVPEIDWLPVTDISERVHVGDLLDVYVLRYNYRDRVVVGSIRRAQILMTIRTANCLDLIRERYFGVKSHLSARRRS